MILFYIWFLTHSNTENTESASAILHLSTPFLLSQLSPTCWYSIATLREGELVKMTMQPHLQGSAWILAISSFYGTFHVWRTYLGAWATFNLMQRGVVIIKSNNIASMICQALFKAPLI